MSLRTGLAASAGWKTEASYGVPLVVDEWLPIRSESLTMEIEPIESESIYTGRETLDSEQWYQGGITVGGDLGMDLYSAGAATLFEHMLGTDSSGTFTPGDLAALSFSVQVGRPGVDGTVRAFNYAGCKVASWEIAAEVGSVATLGLTLVGRAEYRYRVVTDGVTATNTTLTSATAQFSQADIGIPVAGTGVAAATTIASVESATSVTLSAATTATASGVTITFGLALATPTPPSALVPYRFTQAVITVAGTAVPVSSFRIGGDNGLTDRRFLGTPYTATQLTAQLREYTGELTCEFTDLTLYNRFVRGVEGALVATFTAGTRSLTITTNVRFDGTTPTVQGRGIVEQPLQFKCIGDGTDASAVTIAMDET